MNICFLINQKIKMTNNKYVKNKERRKKEKKTKKNI